MLSSSKNVSRGGIQYAKPIDLKHVANEIEDELYEPNENDPREGMAGRPSEVSKLVNPEVKSKERTSKTNASCGQQPDSIKKYEPPEKVPGEVVDREGCSRGKIEGGKGLSTSTWHHRHQHWHG